MAATLAVLAGCAGTRTPGHFIIPASALYDAYGDALARDVRQAKEEGTEPFWNPIPRFSDAHCRWVRTGQEALCRYVELNFPRYSQRDRKLEVTGREPEHRVTRTEQGWDFGF